MIYNIILQLKPCEMIEMTKNCNLNHCFDLISLHLTELYTLIVDNVTTFHRVEVHIGVLICGDHRRLSKSTQRKRLTKNWAFVENDKALTEEQSCIFPQSTLQQSVCPFPHLRE